MQSGWEARISSHVDVALPAERRGLSPSGVVRVRNVVSPTVPTGNVDSGPQGVARQRITEGDVGARIIRDTRPLRGPAKAVQIASLAPYTVRPCATSHSR